MKIKSFIAPTIQEALLSIKREMGDSSLILETRNIDEGDIKSISGKRLVEIVAAENLIEQNTNKELRNKSHSNPFSKIGPKFEKEMPRESRDLYQELLLQQVEAEHAQILMKETLYELNKGGFAKIDSQRSIVKDKITNKINVHDSGLTNGNLHKIMAFVGTSGVGKTTTISKLATDIRMHSDDDILLVSIIEECAGNLEIIAKVIGAKLTIVTGAQEFREIIDKFNNKTHIFIDTPGISHLDNIKLLELKEYVSDIPKLESHLVISATTRYTDIMDIIKKFDFVPELRLLFAKVDETDVHGTLFSAAMETRKPVSYITDGKNIPESFKTATSGMFAKMILN